MSYLFLLLISLNTHACKTNKISSEKKFIASSSIPFETLMTDAMDIMDRDMSKIEVKQSNELLFLELMKSHHEGAINMASAILINIKNSELENFAISIIANQKNEIAYMNSLINKLKK